MHDTAMLCHAPDNALIEQMVSLALAEDIGSGDVTAQLLPPKQQAHATVITREAGILCGKQWFDHVFSQLDPTIQITWHADDGERLQAGQSLCELQGTSRHLLTGERTALNFLQTLSGTATRTRAFVDAIAGTQARVLDTRKTLPLWRVAQKYAVCCGGGLNHRMGLFDMVLIKENHIASAGSVTAAMHQAQRQNPQLAIEIEVETLDQLRDALQAGATRVLLDNMSPADMTEAVRLTVGKAKLEASGNVRLDNIREIALCGVDYISIGSLTKHLQALDLSLRIDNIFTN